MSIKVLVFESDAAFASELRNELGKLGCTVSVVDDGNVGLQQAAADKPDLILLSIELPRMNGFSVCNKLKKDPALKDVPLIIMSSESSDETFEQHRKLRTRAEDYVHKPISFGDLLSRIQQFVRIEQVQSEGQIVIEDEISLAAVEMEDEGTQIAKRPPTFGGQHSGASPSSVAQAPIDPDIDAFADAAFGMLQGDNEAPILEPVNGSHAKSPSEKPAPSARQAAPPPIPQTEARKVPSAKMPSAAPRPMDNAEFDRAKADADKAKARATDLETELAQAKDELSRAKEDSERVARSDAEAQRMQRDIDELKTKLSMAPKGAGTGVSSKEFLDLRETLNKKDKEILNLRDTLTKKEREVLDNADKSLALERAKAEFEDKAADLERELGDAKEKIESLSADKDQAKKASEDFKARHARAQTDLDARTKELTELRNKSQEYEAKSEAEIATLKADMQQSIDAEREAKERATEEAEAKLRAAAESAKKAIDVATENAARERSDALLQRERELRQETDGKLAALHRAHQDELNRTKNDLGQKMAAAEKVATEKLAAREAEQEAKRTSEIDALTRDRDERVASMEADHAARSEAATREHGEKVAAIEADRDDRLARAKREADERVASVENDRDSRVVALESRMAREIDDVRTVAEAQKAAGDEQIRTLETQLRDALAELSALRDAKSKGDAANEASIADLTQRLASTESVRDEAQKSLADARDRIMAMEIDLAAARGELSDTRGKLDTETARNARALVKWESDKTALERAKDALAVALSQIEETETRSLD
jgi:CheY-like chemotaxis protein